jgi:hypothetical protein
MRGFDRNMGYGLWYGINLLRIIWNSNKPRQVINIPAQMVPAYHLFTAIWLIIQVIGTDLSPIQPRLYVSHLSLLL